MMRRLLALMALCFAASALAQLDRKQETPLAMPAVPPAYGFQLEEAFSQLKLQSPLMVAAPPGETNRLFIVERWGTIVVVTNLAQPTRTEFLNVTVTRGCEEGLLGLAFHPDYASNGYFYIFYSLVTNTAQGTGLHQRVARFHVSPEDPNRAEPASELPLFTQFDHACNHNGGEVQFGPDGYLYVGLGDEGGQNDQFQNSQRIDKNFFCGILRLDVDKRPGNLPPTDHPALMGQTNYFIPADNPFVGATQLNGSPIDPAKLRAEFYAIGLRNPWRFTFDPLTGICYCGDVGGDKREEIDVILKGGNYGWVWKEGMNNGPVPSRQAPEGASFIWPIADYGHGMSTNRGNSVTGGIVYRGNRMAQLAGRYIFADYVSGNVWALTPNGTNAVPFERLLGTTMGVCSIGVDPSNNDPLLVNLSIHKILRLVANTNSAAGQPIPPTLSETGAFADVETLKPAPGVAPYEVNVPFWSDNAKKSRWFSVPANQTITFSPDGAWSFPAGTIWVKHFDLELTNGNPASARRLETRLLVKTTNGVYGVTYRWGDSKTNATLVAEEGMDETFSIHEGDAVRTQVWHYPSRSECLICHTPAAGYGLGFNTAQLNRAHNYNGQTANQIEAMSKAGYFSAPVEDASQLRALARAEDASKPLELRARSWLEANCVNCHQPGGTPLASWDARGSTPLSQAGLIGAKPQNDLGNAENRVVTPADPVHSTLLFRISQNGARRMPPLASNLIDTNSVKLIEEWIRTLPRQ